MTNEYNPDGKEIRFIDSHYKDLFHMCFMVEIRCLHTKLVRARPSRWQHRLWRVSGLD